MSTPNCVLCVGAIGRREREEEGTEEERGASPYQCVWCIVFMCRVHFVSPVHGSRVLVASGGCIDMIRQ